MSDEVKNNHRFVKKKLCKRRFTIQKKVFQIFDFLFTWRRSTEEIQAEERLRPKN